MNLRALEEAFLEDLYDERRKLRVELPYEGFVYHARPTSNARAVWRVSLDAGTVAEVYTTRPVRLEAIDKMMQQVEIENVSSARIRQVVARHRTIRFVSGEDDARAQMVKHVAQWIGENFGRASRPQAVDNAKEALDLVRQGGSCRKALEAAEKAKRWFPTFWEALTKEINRVRSRMEPQDSPVRDDAGLRDAAPTS